MTDRIPTEDERKILVTGHCPVCGSEVVTRPPREWIDGELIEYPLKPWVTACCGPCGEIWQGENNEDS